MPVTQVGEVLLTGATGFVGRFVLRDLLRMDAVLVVHCLVRATDGEHGMQRLRAALEDAEIWDEACAARIRVVAGDIGEARLGLGQAAFEDLARRIDAVHHFAADVLLSASYLAIRKTNVFSMRNVLELCLHTRRKHLFHASTMQHFTWQRRQRRPGQQAQWLLKAPIHLMELEALASAYPDACFIATHREPRQFMGSWCSFGADRPFSDV